MKQLAIFCFLFIAGLSTFLMAAEPARVFITDSQSWETRGSAGGANGAWGAHESGGARPQTAEIIKTFGERCPQVKVNNIPSKADYVVVLDHEGGKSVLQHKNKVAVFQRISGDSIVSKSTLSLGGSVQDACEAITADWTANASKIQAAQAAEDAKAAPVPTTVPVSASSAAPKLSISSTPVGADVEVDGSFMGSTPSAIELAAGDHTLVIKKSGYKAWERKLKLTGGNINIAAELEKEMVN